jgi:nitroreductase/NAD-dependent dihydropyrimidine dehydrogenase PreA subunit
MIEINYDRCINCFQCISVCPFKVLSKENGRPEVAAKDRCIKCLHCAAVCPENAVSLEEVEGILRDPLTELPANYSELIENHLMNRRSYRQFQPKTVPKEILEHALKVSAWAPSAKNQHPAKWTVVNDEQTVQTIMDHILGYIRETGASPEIVTLYDQGLNVVTATARTLIFVYSKTTAINPLGDTTLALYNVDLMLQAQGIGTCWAGYLMRMCNQIPALRELLKLPEDCQFYGALMAGYPSDKETYIHIPSRHKLPNIQWI